MGVIPVQVLESIGAAITYPAAVPACGCQRTTDPYGYHLCAYHDGMTDGFHLAQDLQRETDQ